MPSVYYGPSRERWFVQWGRRERRHRVTFRREDTARAFATYIVDQAVAKPWSRTPGSPSTMSRPDRITRNVVVDENGCWRWQRYKMPREGYGVATDRGRRVMAHRMSYETFIGPIADGLHLDHLCRVRDCVNPEHLEPVTPRENVMRSPIAQAALNAAKTECPKGHAYDEANTYVYRGGRVCRACAAAHHARYRARASAQKAS